MAGVDYKIKYLDLRSKFMKTAERMYRLGKEDGLKEGQMQAQQQQMQQQAEMEAMQAQQAGMGGEPQIDPETGEPMPPQEGMEPGMQEAMGPEEMAQMQEEGMDQEQGSELDQRINELESLVAKGEKPKVTDLRKAVIELAELRKSQKQMKSNHKKVTSSKQKGLVDSILKKWESEANKDSQTKELERIIQSEGIEIK